MNPRGTLRSRFAKESDDVFRRLGVGARRCDLGDEGLYLAEELVAADRWLGGSDPEALGILVLALMVAQRQGSTRLALDSAAKGKLRTLCHDIVRVAQLDLDVGKLVKRITGLTAAPRFNSIIGVGDKRLPLVVDDGSLYTERARWLEVRVAERIAARVAAPLREVAPISEPELSDEQRAAVALAAGSQLAIVTGGPGTGKTRVIAAIVRAYERAGIPAERIALAAPTGKAANRLAEVVGRPALTIHRLLGYHSDGSFAHHERSPLPYAVVIVDEASMIDLELADALLAALPAAAPLVLVGDAHQLPAVDAGQILADLACSPPPGGAAEQYGAAGAEEGTSARVATLAHSYRMDAADPRGRAVLEAARAVHAGNAPPATARTPGTLRFEGVEHVQADARQVAESVWHHFEGPRAQRLANELVFRFADGRIAPEQAQELEQLWHLASRARILAVTRELPTGARAINAHLHALALARMSVAGHPDFVPGEPVMITANDYQRSLFNGDQGLVIRADEGLGGHRYRAVFRVGGQLVPFAIEALRDRLELAWSLTVHKSQGSELDAIALVLPDDDLPLVTRELLYTGITRARTSVVLCASKPALAAAVKRRALRDSGLAARIRATLGT